MDVPRGTRSYFSVAERDQGKTDVKNAASEDESSGNRANNGLAERRDWMRGVVHTRCSCGRAGRPGGTGKGWAPAHWEGGREEAGKG